VTVRRAAPVKTVAKEEEDCEPEAPKAKSL